MNKDEALNFLQHGTQHERLKASYTLLKLAQREDLNLLLQIKHLETDAVVKRRIDAIIAYVQKPPTRSLKVKEKITPEADINHVRNSSLDWIANMLLHEVGSKIGLLALSVKTEFPKYESSQTYKYVKHLQTVFDAIEQLRSVNSTPKIEDFILHDLIDEIIKIEQVDINLEISKVGIKTLVAKGDKKFVELALCNGLRNAIEAINGVDENGETNNSQDDKKNSITVSWGKTDKHYWISIIDSGPGLPDKNVFNESGKSSKKGHSGYGLQISKQAMERLEGTVILSNSVGGGATYIMRWNVI